jgi:hypothetical protein
MHLSLWTGCKPTKRTYDLVCYFFLGLASETALVKSISSGPRSRSFGDTWRFALRGSFQREPRGCLRRVPLP